MYAPTPFKEGFLPEEDGHKIYYAEYGNPDGEVIVHLHGGPGSESKTKHAQMFDLDRYHVVLFDQRGCGKSEPKGKTADNTTQKLVGDIERLREALNVERWFVSGRSWGSTLSLVYGETYPNRVRALLLGSIFIGDTFGIDWGFAKEGGIEAIFSDVWQKRVEALREYGATPENAAKVLLKKLEEGTDDEQKHIAATILNWEFNLMTAANDVVYYRPEDIDAEKLTYTRIFLHYEAHQFFLEDNEIMNNIDALEDIPTILVHGRYDLLCPFRAVWQLHKELPRSQVVVLPQSNHAFSADGHLASKYAFDSFLKDVV